MHCLPFYVETVGCCDKAVLWGSLSAEKNVPFNGEHSGYLLIFPREGLWCTQSCCFAIDLWDALGSFGVLWSCSCSAAPLDV